MDCIILLTGSLRNGLTVHAKSSDSRLNLKNFTLHSTPKLSKQVKIYNEPLIHGESQKTGLLAISMKINLSHISSTLAIFFFSFSCAAANTGRTCEYNPDLGIPNPLGMRTFISLKEEGGNTIVIYEQLPSPVAGDGKVTIGTKRELTFHQTTIDTARVKLLQDKNYYSELVGYEDKEGFEPVNKVLICR